MPISTLTAARNEILLHFTTAWNAQTPPVPLLLYTDKHKDPPDDASYARIKVIHNIFDQVTVGGKKASGGSGQRFRRFGIVTVQVFTISGGGQVASDAFVDVALAAFEGQNTGSDRIEFRNARVNEIGQDGPWFQVNVIAEFDYDKVV